jgi:cholesterol transport system auxiliary component
MNRAAKLLVVALLVLFAGACGLGRPEFAAPVVHDFGPEPAAPSHNPTGWSVASGDAPAWLQDDRIRYRLLYADPSRVRHYSRDLWAAPAPHLLFRRLDAAGDGGEFRLRVEVPVFEQVFDAPEQARALLHLNVVAYRPGAAQPAAERRFRFDEPTPTADAHGAVLAFTRLAERAVEEIRAWLNALPKGNTP